MLPILITQPLSSYMQVLEAFRKENAYEGLRVNNLWRATGSKDKPAILKGISFLRRCEIIQTERINKQKVINKLTSLGRELKDLLDDIDRYNQSITKIRILVSDYYKPKEANRSKRSRLLRKGWTNPEIESLPGIWNTLIAISNFCNKNICNAFLHRYYFILVFYKPNRDAQNVLLEIILEQIKKQLFGREIKAQVDSNYLEGSGKSLSTAILNDIYRMYYDHDVFFQNNPNPSQTNRFTTKSVQGLFFSFIMLARLNLNQVEFFIQELHQEENQHELEEIIGIFKSYLAFCNNYKGAQRVLKNV